MKSARPEQVRLKMLAPGEYASHPTFDPIKFYRLPVFGKLYRRRVEMCLAECTGGERVLEVGFGSGVTFLNLSEMYREIHGIDLTSPVDVVASVFEKRRLPVFLQTGDVLEMTYADDYFDTVLLISILEHLKPADLALAFKEIFRVLKPGGQVVFGVPVDRRLMIVAFRLLGYDIGLHHFSSEKEVVAAAGSCFGDGRVVVMKSLFGPIYEVGSFVKNAAFRERVNGASV